MKKLIIITVSLLLVGGGIFGYMKYQESQESTGRPFDPEWGKVNVKIGPFEDCEYTNSIGKCISLRLTRICLLQLVGRKVAHTNLVSYCF